MREVVGSTLFMAGLTLILVGAIFRTGLGVWLLVLPGLALVAISYPVLHAKRGLRGMT